MTLHTDLCSWFVLVDEVSSLVMRVETPEVEGTVSRFYTVQFTLQVANASQQQSADIRLMSCKETQTAATSGLIFCSICAETDY